MNYYNEIKKELINNEINKAVKNYSINRSDLNSYYNVGKILSEAGKHYGEGIIKEYSKKLKYDLNKNYSVRLLYRMLKYYNFASEENLPTLSAKLSWSHYDEILRFDDINEITFYIRISEQQNLSVRQLREKIKSNEYERLPEATKSKLINQQESNVVDFVKNPIKIKNSNKYDIFSEKVFEDIKHIDENKNEYWLARELMPLLEYAEWRKFKGVINKGIINCKNSNYNALDHFVGADKMVSIVSQTTRNIQDYKLTRYACYLIVLNCDPRKKIISLAKTYFAIQTRKQELSEKEYNSLTENEKRLYRRNQARKGNLNLNKTAINSDVKDLVRFHNTGYKGLYNGETADDIFKRKKLRYRNRIK